VGADHKTEELTAIIHEIRDRVRSRYPERTAGEGVVLPDLEPLLHERDAAEGKVAAIGSVNPRPPGLINSAAQAWKKLISRLLDWHVREQIEFNRATVRSLDAILEALNENNRALQALGGAARQGDEAMAARFDERIDALNQRLDGLDSRVGELLEVRDIRAHWSQWRVEWENRLDSIERQFFRNVAELHGAFQHRATLLETNLRDTTKLQHSDFLAALWKGIHETRAELERLIHTELRLVRQRAALPQMLPAAVPQSDMALPAPSIDWLHFAERFRGTEEYVREKQRFYVPHFAGRQNVLDIGCGRGEFLDLMKEAGVAARGIDLSTESIAVCRSKGLDAEVADLFAYLSALADESLAGIFCAQVIEHLPPARLPEMLHLAAAKLARDGMLVIETPNPECLAIFATHFYLDPTHQRPVPSQLVDFYLREFGMGNIETHHLTPAAESFPDLNTLPEGFRAAFFGALDYAIVARKL
jgi:2-polyprenyl-3-methyl-5-hydroxy-6-metoxy-1,4-benzoquinol methylase